MAYNGAQGDPQNRMICANCRANNFAGQPRCWQCGAPLSAARGNAQPTAHRTSTLPTQLAAPTSLPQFVQPDAPRRASAARPSALLLIGVAMMTFVIVLMLNMRPQSGSAPIARSAPSGIDTGRPTSDPASEINAGQAGDVGRMNGTETSGGLSAPDAGNSASSNPTAGNATSTSSTAGGDPLEDAAKRVITREAPNVGLPPAGAVSPDGQVHLRSGRSISVEEWNAAKRKLQDNPLLNEPPAPPPF